MSSYQSCEQGWHNLVAYPQAQGNTVLLCSKCGRMLDEVRQHVSKLDAEREQIRRMIEEEDARLRDKRAQTTRLKQ